MVTWVPTRSKFLMTRQLPLLMAVVLSMMSKVYPFVISAAEERLITIPFSRAGLDRAELVHLATGRRMVREFDRTKLSAKGFFVDINDRDITLPDGTVVENGITFRYRKYSHKCSMTIYCMEPNILLPCRNEFHLNPLSSATLFVPCGGRPEAVNISNVDKFFTKRSVSDGDKRSGQERVPRFKYIVEGANLFFTQEARLILEG